MSDLMIQMKKVRKHHKSKYDKLIKELMSLNVDGWVESNSFLHTLCRYKAAVQLLWQVLAWMTGPFDRLMRNKVFNCSLPENRMLLKDCCNSNGFTNDYWLKKADRVEGQHGNKAHAKDGDRVSNEALNDSKRTHLKDFLKAEFAKMAVAGNPCSSRDTARLILQWSNQRFQSS